MSRVLLVSNSGRPFLAWCRPLIGEFLASEGGHTAGADAARRVTTLAFVTAANLGDERLYWGRARQALEPPPPEGLGLTVTHCDWRAEPRGTLERADALFVGGGNTYALLRRLSEAKLLDPIRERVRAGMPYVGSSAGSNVAGPNILTTNDWNVVALSEFRALGLVPFNVNPHYLETDPAMAAHSETRDDRIAEYHVVNDNAVVGIEEGTAVRAEDGVAVVQGNGRVKLFQRGEPPRWFNAGEVLPV
ncbi:MAG: dipeptidase PepE [Candidatus Rokubacteria bacterium]|nr:dipeptidase PepE [Candidatus Rokubacteria bacterium]